MKMMLTEISILNEKYKKEDEEHQRYVDRIRAENRTIRTYGEYTEKESAAVINIYDDGER